MTKKVSFGPSILIFQIFENWIKIAYLNDVLAVKFKNVMRLLRVFQTTVCTWVEMIEILFCYLFFTPFLSLTWNTMKSSISKKCIFKGWIAPWLLKIQPCQVSQIMHWIHVFLGRKKLNTLLRSLLYLFQQELLSCLQWHCCVQKKDASPTWSCCLLQGVLSFKKPRDSLARSRYSSTWSSQSLT